MSDGYKRIDNLDVLLAALDGVRQAGAPVKVDGCDLTERKMYVRVVCEQVRALAPALLNGYRSPYTGAAGADNPVVFATAGGILHAVTSVAQTLPDADAAHDMEAAGLRALEIAASL